MNGQEWEQSYDDPDFLAPTSPTPDTDENMDIEETKQLIADWFLDNFEDPSDNTPYDKKAKRYLFIWGGPYYTHDELYYRFDDSSPEGAVDEAIDDYLPIISEWAPHHSRIPSDFQNPESINRRILKYIEDVQGALGQLGDFDAAASMGHNNPPESLRHGPLTDNGRLRIIYHFDYIKEQSSTPQQSDIDKLADVASDLRQTGFEIKTWATGQLDLFSSELSKSAGAEVGKWAPRALYLFIADRLLGYTIC